MTKHQYGLQITMEGICNIQNIITYYIVLIDLMEKDWPLLDNIGTEVDRVWHLQNKYYRANVGIQVWPDIAAPPPLPARVEAHIIYMLADEVRPPRHTLIGLNKVFIPPPLFH